MPDALPRRVLGFLAATAILCAPLVPADAKPAVPTATIADGALSGVKQEDFAVFKGIPYAAPPVGPLRWRPPQPVAPWTGTKDASNFGDTCVQPDLTQPKIKKTDAQAVTGKEDCLTVNVWTPQDFAGKKLPVMVSVHGGAFFVGSGQQGLDEGISELSKRGVVVVSFNYRLGRMGFFAHPALGAEHPDEATANFWLMDQIAALRWVHRNIAAFGGDPANVTIFGVSAGGTSINALMASPEARGLFAKAISQSGGSLFNATTPLPEAEKVGQEVAARLGVPGDGADVPAKLRAIAAEKVVAAENGPPAYGAIIDGKVLTKALPVSFATGDIAPVPYMAGTTSDEFSIFSLMGFTGETLEQRFGVKLKEARPVYEADGKLTDDRFVSQVGTDFIFTAGANGLAAMAARNGHPAYVYRMAYVADGIRDEMPNGVPHGGDQPYVFGLDYKWQTATMAVVPDPTDKDRRVAAMIEDYMTNFAKTGDPNGKSLPDWPRYDGATGTTLVIDDDTKAVPGFRKAQLELWFRMWEAQSGLTVTGP